MSRNSCHKGYNVPLYCNSSENGHHLAAQCLRVLGKRNPIYSGPETRDLPDVLTVGLEALGLQDRETRFEVTTRQLMEIEGSSEDE